MPSPIIAMETNVAIAEEVLTTKTFTKIRTKQTITINNTGNVKRKPQIKITANGNVTSLVIENQNSGSTITYTTALAQGDILEIKNDISYKNTVADYVAVFNAPFYIEENDENVISFTFSGGSNIDVEVSWEYPSSNAAVMAYVQNLRISEARTYQRKQSLYSTYKNGAVLKDVDFVISIGKMWSDSVIFNGSPEKSYRLVIYTDDDATGIEQQAYVFCNCRFTSKEISSEGASIVTENIDGFADKMFKLPYSQI